MDARRYRLIYTGLGLALVAVVALAVAFGSPDGAEGGLPPPVEAVSPRPGETVPRQSRLEIDMQAGYAVEIFVDNFRIPSEEIFWVEGTGVHSWQPTPSGVFTEWATGEHHILIRWDTTSGLADPGSYEWSFRSY